MPGQKNKKLSLKDQIIIFLEDANMAVDEEIIADVLGEKRTSVRATLGELKTRGTVGKSKSHRLWFFRSEKPTK